MTSVETDRATDLPQRTGPDSPQNTAPSLTEDSPATVQDRAPQTQAGSSFVVTADRCSPDPLQQTDRYRLNMPFLDRLD